MSQEEKKFDLLLQLPKELSFKVLTYLTGKELSVACRVSKSWRDIANYNLLWKRVCTSESICCENEILKVEQVDSGSRLEAECKWSQIYHERMRLLANWAGDRYTWMAIDQEKPSVDVCHSTLAVAHWVNTTPTIDILSINSSSLLQVQTLILPFNLTTQRPLGIRVQCNLLTVELSNVSVIYKCVNGKFVYEISIVPDLKMVCNSGEEQDFVEKYNNDTRCWTLCLAGRYVWYQASTLPLQAIVVIYDRNTKKFIDMEDILQVVAVDIQGELVVVQCPHSIRVFYSDGKLLYTYTAFTNLFFTGLVTSSTSFAFLQSEDFSDPHVVQVELRTWEVYKETQLKVYRIALHQNTILLLSQDPFTLTSVTQGDTNWSNFIRGTKYLRPGKDIFTVICSKYVFVCPSLARLDMFSLYDVNNGDHLYDTSLNTSSYNIQNVSDTCLVIYTKKTTVNVRSYV